MRAAAFLALALSAAAPAAAQSIACNPAGNQAEMNQCAFDDLRKADAELNATYAQVLAKLKGQTVALARLKTAQRLWVQLRDADLAAQFPVADKQDPRVTYGSIYSMDRAGAQAELTRQRTAYLRKQFLAPAGEGR
ncbi:lysozyme inhibitor LprI family protein [Stenotrophomonas sp. HITSZ_GD]|uniref:lysozyme inhibitor LprI family protein n=1 Tax=Stenotrophomonas sp. HITSZ_GD TaxID=3037248 RepID=UPI00240D218C|nr:lysozyme inhibitor LprI family protein [Stenotrophomonas sp. HITSZ_GD]MDG2525536.1 lysozyme inhibitor LprI family protein [Stenotrophomonas sp. HITSZ_GD]